MKPFAWLRKRPVLLLGLLAVLLLVTGGSLLVWVNGPRHRINEDSFKKIQEGMTLAEVEEIIGVPPGDYHGFGRQVNAAFPETQRVKWDKEVRINVKWACQDTYIIVSFDDDNRVARKYTGPTC